MRGRRGERHVDGVFDLARDPVGADEVPARAARDHRHLGLIVEIGDPVHDLVHGAVPADDDEQLRAAVGRLAGELAELARAFREERVAR